MWLRGVGRVTKFDCGEGDMRRIAGEGVVGAERVAVGFNEGHGMVFGSGPENGGLVGVCGGRTDESSNVRLF